MDTGYQNINDTAPRKRNWGPIIGGVALVGAAAFVAVYFLVIKKDDSGSGGGGGPPGQNCASISPGNATISEGCKKGDKTCNYACNNGYYLSDDNFIRNASCTTTGWYPAVEDCLEPHFDLAFVALGDWGTSYDLKYPHTSSTRNDVYNTPKWWKDYDSQENIGYLMAMWAEQNNAQFVVGQGDNFYWNGVTSVDDIQFMETFEKKYNYSSLYIPWYNVMGNHDYGGSGVIVNDHGAAGMTQMVEAQKNYQSLYGKQRWNMRDSMFYSAKHEVTDAKVPFAVEVFNFDSNHAQAEGHGKDEICCQIFGYANKGCDDDICRNIPEYNKNKGCAPSNSTASCRDYIDKLWEGAKKGLAEATKASTATWKIANTHYHARIHMTDPDRAPVYESMQNGVQMYFCGHTHGEGHEFHSYDNGAGTGLHIMLNGAGGGINVDLAGDEDKFAMWQLKDYAFIGVKLNSKIARLTYWTFDHNWGDWTKQTIKKGGMRMDHCWDIPVDGTIGRACS